MCSQENLNFHSLFFTFSGIFPAKEASTIRKILTVFFLYLISVGLSLSQTICIFYVKTIDEVIDHLLISSSMILGVIKAFAIQYQYTKSVAMESVLIKLDGFKLSRQSDLYSTKKKSMKITYSFIFAYHCAWAGVAIHTVMSPQEERLYSSTSLYPSAVLHHSVIYAVGLGYQCASNYIMCVLIAFLDAYGVVLLNVLNGHIQAIRIKLQSINYCRPIKKSVGENEILTICKAYKACLK